MRRVLVVGGSIAAATAAGTLRAEGWDGELIVASDEEHRPYSRVPLSKQILMGTQELASSALPELPQDVDIRLSMRAVALDRMNREVRFADGSVVGFDGLVVATGARARRIAVPGQHGELVLRTRDDAAAIIARAETAATAIVVGAGFLGMELASTLSHRGLDVTVISRFAPLSQLLGPWLAAELTAAATRAGVRMLRAPGGVTLIGNPVDGVACSPHGALTADLIVSAVGDIANTEWLSSSGLAVAEGVVVDQHCVAAPGVVAAGDVASLRTGSGVSRRTPHWTSAVHQAGAAARALLDPPRPHRALPAPYVWTEQFGVDMKIAGQLPAPGTPRVLQGDPGQGSAVVQWRSDDGRPTAAASLNFRIPIVKLTSLAR